MLDVSQMVLYFFASATQKYKMLQDKLLKETVL